jgi:hypothetical protein
VEVARCLLRAGEEQAESREEVMEAHLSLAQTEFWVVEVVEEAHWMKQWHGVVGCLVLEEVVAQDPCLVLVVGHSFSVPWMEGVHQTLNHFPLVHKVHQLVFSEVWEEAEALGLIEM